jgi:peptide deformylase
MILAGLSIELVGLFESGPKQPHLREHLMALLTILEFPDPRLRTKAVAITDVNDDIRHLIDDMVETMYAANGVGLAATQVNVHKRLVVIDVSDERNQPRAFINPVIIAREGVEVTEEGCLSVPGSYDEVERAQRVTVRALDRNGEEFTLAADGLLGVCIQHELDHLEGKLFVDYLSELKRTRIRKKLEKEHKERAGKAARKHSSTPAI